MPDWRDRTPLIERPLRFSHFAGVQLSEAHLTVEIRYDAQDSSALPTPDTLLALHSHKGHLWIPATRTDKVERLQTL